MGQMLREDENEDQHNNSDMDVDLRARQNEILEDEDEEFDEDEEMEEDEEDDDRSETMSLTEDDIDFNLVYAFHTFVATQEGQASVVRNDSLMLLEDANVYWWLVRVLKTGVIGYIPAENIETPFERLARLNKYRNVGLSAPSPEWGTFDDPIQPLDPATLAERSSNRRSVIFAAQNEFFGASENEWDSDEDSEGDEDDEMGEYYEGGEEDDGGEESDRHGEEGSVRGKTALQLEAERVEQEILQEQREQQQKPSSRNGNQQRQQYGVDESEQEDEDVEDEDQVVTNRHRRPLLDDDDLTFSDEPRKISLTPSIAQDDVSVAMMQAPPGKAKKLRLDEASLNSSSSNSSLRSNGSGSGPSTQQQRQQTQQSNEYRDQSIESGDDDRQNAQKRMHERSEAKLALLLGEKDQSPSARSDNEPQQEVVKKPGKFKSLFGVGKGSKDKEKERKEKERQEKERLKNTGSGDGSTNKGPTSQGSSNNSGGNGNGAYRVRTNSVGSLNSVGTSNSANTPMSPTHSENGDALQQEIITLRVYPGNVDFGASMYKTVVVSSTTMASEVANHAVVKFKLAPDGVASATDFFLTVRGVDGDETVLQPTDKIMAIYQSLTAHLTTPLPANHRLSISSVSSMMSVNSTSSYNSNGPSTPTSPNSVRRIGSGKTDPHQRSIRFLLNKKIRRVGSGSSVPGTPTTPTTPTTPGSSTMQEDFFWIKVICQTQELPQTMLFLDGMGTALEKSDPRAQGQSATSKVEHWVPMHAASNAGDVVFNALEKIGIRSGVVHGVPEHVVAAKRSSVPNGIVVEYQLSLRLNGQTSRRAKQGDEILLPPHVPLTRCFEDHQLVPVRRSPKADVASMPLSPDYIFYLKKAARSLQAEKKLAEEQQQQQERQQRKVPAPLQATSIRSNGNVGEPLRSPNPVSPTGMSSPRSLRSLRSIEDLKGSESNINGNNGPASPGLHQSRSSSRNGSGSPSLMGGSGDVGNIRIPRRTDSAGPTSPTQAQQVNMMGSRTPTPDHVGRNRSPSVSQGQGGNVNIRPGQTSSPTPSHHSSHAGTDQDGSASRSSTPERPARAERQQRAPPSMTHGPSPLSLAAVMLQDSNNNSAANVQQQQPEGNATGDRPLSIAPLSIKKNGTLGMDITLNKGVIRSSRLMNSKQYRYSFIPVEGGEEVDISEIIEDILGEDNDEDEDDDMERLQHSDVNDETPESVARRSGSAVAAGAGKDPRLNNVASQPRRSLSNGSRQGASVDRDRLELLTNSARGGSTLMKLERVLAGDHDNENSRPSSRSRTNSPRNAAAAQNRAPASASAPSPSSQHSKRDSDVEIQVASLASLNTRSASPMLTDQAPSARGLDSSTIPPGSPRSARPSSPFSMMAKGTLLSNTNSAQTAASNARSSPLKEGNIVESSTASIPQDVTSSGRSFSPIPRRLQSPSPAARQNPTSSSPTAGRPASPSGGRVSPASARSNSAASITAISARNRSASTSVADSHSSAAAAARLASISNGSNNSSTTSLNSSTSNGGNKEWLLSSDYNAGMQDLLTLVRAGRSSSVSSGSSGSSMMRLGPLIGKDGKVVALPSTIKASLLQSNGNLSRSRSPSLSQLQGHLDNQYEQEQDKKKRQKGGDGKQSNDNKLNGGDNANDKAMKDGQTRMMLMMLNELSLKDVQQECHPEVYDCWKDVDADLDRVERELDELLVSVKASML
ncbi:hypothetical protein EDD21DRAFT_363337 [Dissophora ornata]|nr:hypothetical protein EDD21DRAFT_363337 [Dissophora ornata]